MSHSSPHEGTNHGLKSHSAGVKATMNVDLSAKTLNTQTSIKVAESECNELIYQEAMYTHKKWSQLPTLAFSVSVAEGILQGIMHRVNQFHACLVSKSESKTVFQVSCMGGDQAHKSSESPEHYSGDESIESTNSSLFYKDSIVENNHTVSSHIPRLSAVGIDSQITTSGGSMGGLSTLPPSKTMTLSSTSLRVNLN